MSEVLTNVSRVEGLHEAPEFIDPENHASKERVVERVRQEVWPLFGEAKDRRTWLEDQWRKYYKIWKGTHQVKYYDGEADLRVKMGRKVIDTFVAQTRSQIFPQQQLFYIEPADAESAKQVPIIQKLLEHDLEQTRLDTLSDLFLMNGFVYGSTFLKTDWRVDSYQNYRRRRVELPGGQMGREVTREKVYTYEGPKTTLVDPLRFYIYPITARNLDDAVAMFEDMEVSWNFLKGMESRGVYHKVDRVKEGSIEPVSEKVEGGIESNRDERVDDHGYQVTTPKGKYRIVECYTDFDLYGNGLKVPCKITWSGNDILEVRQNPFFDQRHPYDQWRAIDLMDNVYGQGIVELMEDMQYAIDAFINQAVDSGNFQINHITLAMEDAVDFDTIQVSPRAIWAVRPGMVSRASDAASIVRPPDTMSTALSAAQFLIQLMQDTVSAHAILQGQVSGGETTATEASTAAQNAAAFVTTQASRVESQLLSPLLQRYHMREEQFRSPESLARIAGASRTGRDIQGIVGDYSLRWHVSQQAAQAMQLEASQGGMTARPTKQGEQNGQMGLPGLGNVGSQ